MKKMLKRLGVVIPSTILSLLMAVGFSTPAFAYVDKAETEEPVQVVEEAEPTEEEKIPFTIAGNGEVEDNIVDDPSKEFFTVKTKGGNTFFLVIDRARDSENVYMLSMIDAISRRRSAANTFMWSQIAKIQDFVRTVGMGNGIPIKIAGNEKSRK